MLGVWGQTGLFQQCDNGTALQAPEAQWGLSLLLQAPITPLTWLTSTPSSSWLQNEDGDSAHEQYMAIPACQLLPAPHEGGVMGGDRPEQMLEAQTS